MGTKWSEWTPEKRADVLRRTRATRRLNEERERQREAAAKQELRQRRAAWAARQLKKDPGEFGPPKPDVRRTVPGSCGRLYDFEGIEQSYIELRSAQFWAFVDRSGGPDACWPWLGPRSRSRKTGQPVGYGSSSWRGSSAGAHRVAWMLATGYEIPPGLVIDHMCEVTWCVNGYSHLLCTTHSYNLVLRGKGARPPALTRERTSFDPPRNAQDDENQEQPKPYDPDAPRHLSELPRFERPPFGGIIGPVQRDVFLDDDEEF